MVRGALIVFLALAAAPARANAEEAAPRASAVAISTPVDESTNSLQAIEDGLGRRTRMETVRLVEGWIGAHPGDPEVARAMTWEGHLQLQIPDVPAARRAYGRAIAMGGIWSFRAYAALGDLEMLERNYAGAISAYEGASASPENAWASYGQEGIVAARVAQREAWTAVGAAGALSLQTILCGLAAWRRRGWSAFWPLPWEIKFYLPFAIVMSLAASSILPTKRATIRMVCWGGLAVISGHAVYFRATPPTRWNRAVGSFLAILSAVALVYAALVANGLLGTIGAGGEGE
jgi:hypothetical protein